MVWLFENKTVQMAPVAILLIWINNIQQFICNELVSSLSSVHRLQPKWIVNSTKFWMFKDTKSAGTRVHF